MAAQVMQQKHPGKLVYVHHYGTVLDEACEIFCQNPQTKQKLARTIEVYHTFF
jgi:hypothetical protein